MKSLSQCTTVAMEFYNLSLLAKVVVLDLLNDEKTNNHHLHSSSPNLVFKFHPLHPEQTSFIFGNPTTTTENDNHYWPLLVSRKQRTTLNQKPCLFLPQTTTTYLSSSSSKEDQEFNTNSVLPIKKRKWKMSSSSEAENQEKRKKMKITSPTWDNQEPKELSIGLKNKIQKLGGQDCRLIVEKQLMATDVKKHNTRLLIPVSDAQCLKFLREEEKEKLKEKDEKHKKRIK